MGNDEVAPHIITAHTFRIIMTTSRPLLTILFIGLSALVIETSFAQDARSREGADEETIRALEFQERLAVVNRDTVSLKRIWAERFMVNAPSNRISPDRSFALDLIQTGAIHYSSFERDIECLRIEGDIAIVMGAETIRPTGNAPRAGETVQRRFTHVWKRDGDTWRLIARHANVLPPD